MKCPVFDVHKHGVWDNKRCPMEACGYRRFQDACPGSVVDGVGTEGLSR